MPTTTDTFRQAVLDGLARNSWLRSCIEYDADTDLLIAGDTDADDGYGWRRLNEDEWSRLSAATPEQVTGVEDIPNAFLFDNWRRDLVASLYVIDGMTLVLCGWSVYDMLRNALDIGMPYVLSR